MKFNKQIAYSLLLTAGIGSATFWASNCSEPEAATKSPVELVNPFIGTGGHGHTFPGATVPFGMVQLSPDTRLEGWDGCSGYHFTDSIVYGFSHTHLSGTGVSDYGDVLLMPVTGETTFDNGYKTSVDEGYASRFDKKTEKASPGYYSMHLTDYNIDVELTATERTGWHKYSFPTEEAASIILDLQHRDRATSAGLKIVSETEVEGHRISAAWAREQHVYFVAQFSSPIQAHQLAEKDSVQPDASSLTGTHVKAALDFGKLDKPLIVKVGISATSIEGARKNLEQEGQGWDFDKTHQAAVSKWESSLGKISIKGGTKSQQTTFYTALYHNMLAPNLFSDVDGKYRGHDMQIHQADQTNVYTVFSLWDTFRATHPLYTLIEQKRTNEFINTFLNQYEQGGLLPVWELAGNETFCMIGYHSVPVIADAYAKGIRDYDVNKAFEAMKFSSNKDHLGLSSYRSHGYIPSADEAESVSKTLEYSYDDWCIAMMASDLGKSEDAAEYTKRSQSYKNIYDPETGFMRARQNGGWFGPFDPAEVNFNYTEANSWQYSLFAPHDVTGLMDIMGGKEGVETMLDNLFSASSETSGRHQADITGLIGQYAHGNEPSHHMAYLYNYINHPWKTQHRVRQIMDELYTDQPDGLSGNEDCGQMSAWYVLSAMGFYSVTPGLDYYTIGTPLFEAATLNLENGNKFTVSAENHGAANMYIQSATLNGEPWTKSYINHADIMKGGNIVFTMGPEPNKNWGNNEADIPVASAGTSKITPVPFILAEARSFQDSMAIEMGCAMPDVTIHYTTDGSEPTTDSPVYTEKFFIHETCDIKAIAVSSAKQPSYPVEGRYLKITNKMSITVNSKYANQYNAGGDMALIDQIRAGQDFRTGVWQGYREDLEVIIDLHDQTKITSLSTGFHQDIKSWIFFPPEVEYSVSNDGNEFRSVGVVKPTVPDNQYGKFSEDFTAKVNETARYIKINAKNYGVCPDWHLGAGGVTWIFTDEFMLNQH